MSRNQYFCIKYPNSKKNHISTGSFGSPPLYSLLPLWAGDAKEGQWTKMLCPEFDGKSSCPLKGKY